LSLAADAALALAGALLLPEAALPPTALAAARGLADAGAGSIAAVQTLPKQKASEKIRAAVRSERMGVKMSPEEVP
jgi:hypothetical protein